MNIRPNVIVLNVPMLSPMYGPSVIHPVLIKEDDGLTLVDTGMLGQFTSLQQAIQEAGETISDIKRILITHQDIDHIGNILLLAKELPDVELLVYEDELPYLNGSKSMIKMTPERISQLPNPFREMVEELLNGLTDIGSFQVLHDGEVLPWGGGVEVIHTPGHTPGHICLYLRDQELLLAADELRVVEGELAGPAEFATPDMPLALRSLRKLMGRPIQTIVCYHGGVYEGSPQVLIDTLTEPAS